MKPFIETFTAQKLYPLMKSMITFSSSRLHSTEKKLNQIEQDSCEGSLTRAECLKARKEMDTNKTPGSDGLPTEIYKIFWNDIADFLLGSINYAYKTGQLSVSQKRGIVKLIPKKDAEAYYVKN